MAKRARNSLYTASYRSNEASTPTPSSQQGTPSQPEPPLPAAGIRRTWDDEKDLALVQCFMHNQSHSSAVMSRQTSSVWRKIVRTVFASSLKSYDERGASDSARHRLTKLRSYAAQIQRLLQTTDRLFVWDASEHRLVVNTEAGHDPGVTWNKIQNSQIRKRLMNARYPWFSLLPVTEKDLSSTFYSSVLPWSYFSRSSVGSSEQEHALSPSTTQATRHEDRDATPVPPRPHFSSTVS